MLEEGNCSFGDCSKGASIPCSYIDRTGAPCPLLTCSSHQELVRGTTYCRDHASGTRALPPSYFPENLPPLGNLSLSRATFADQALQDRISSLLKTNSPEHASEPYHYFGCYPFSESREPSWGAGWEITFPDQKLGHAHYSVELFVEEERDQELCLSLNGELLGRIPYPANSNSSSKDPIYEPLLDLLTLRLALLSETRPIVKMLKSGK